MTRSFLITVDMAELTLRMVEAALQTRRPPDRTAIEALHTMPDEDEQAFHRAARAAADYFGEQMAAAMGSDMQTVDLEGAGHA